MGINDDAGPDVSLLRGGGFVSLVCGNLILRTYRYRKAAVVDHNILKHLSIDRQAEHQKNLDLEKEEEEKELKTGLDYAAMLGDMKRKKLPDLAVDSAPPPTFEEKKKLRENMFNFFEESAIEETRLVSLSCLGFTQ
jgi:hypothetical protein